MGNPGSSTSPYAGPRVRTLDPGRLALGLEGLMERACAACPGVAASPVADFAFGGKWLAARLEDGSCGRAFTFIGEHEVHGPLDVEAFGLLGELVGLPAARAFACVRNEAESLRGRLGRLADIVAVALVNAVASAGNAPDALAGRGLAFIDDPVAAFVRADDCVCVVGAGPFLEELEACPARVDVCDLRPAYDLMGLRVGPAGVERHPSHLALHRDASETPELLARADVVFLTGSTLVNGTFFSLAPLCARAREMVLFGPSGCAPFEALVELGVTCVAGSHVTDAAAFMDSVARRREGRGRLGEMLCASYMVTFPRT